MRVKMCFLMSAFGLMQPFTYAQAEGIYCKPGDKFYQKMGTAMFLIKQCPSLKLNKVKSEQAAAAIGLDLKSTPPECAKEWGKAAFGGMMLPIMFNGAGGPFPCDKLPIEKNPSGIFDFVER